MEKEIYYIAMQKGGRCLLVITQKNLIKQISENENINLATVQKIFKAAENIIFDNLSSTTPSENTIIKILDGLSLECNYIPEKEIHTYDNIVCKARVWTKPKITRYYNRKLNGYFIS
jgi:hypothetical protein